MRLLYHRAKRRDGLGERAEREHPQGSDNGEFAEQGSFSLVERAKMH